MGCLLDTQEMAEGRKVSLSIEFKISFYCALFVYLLCVYTSLCVCVGGDTLWGVVLFMYVPEIEFKSCWVWQQIPAKPFLQPKFQV